VVAWWAAEGREIDRSRRALRTQLLKTSEREDPFAAVIRCTADPAKADKRTRSKWSRVMRYAAVYKPDSEPLDRFVKRKGGLNACAARSSRRLGPRGGNGVREGAGRRMLALTAAQRIQISIANPERRQNRTKMS
jgi:hypothetical protein